MNTNNISDLDRIPVKHLVSKRDIGIEAFELENGNLMLEATLLDPYHLIRFNMHIEPQSKLIVHAKSEFANNPHGQCPIVSIKAAMLIGLKIERGIVKEVTHRIGGSDGCVHLRELILETINFAATTLIGYDQGLGLMNRSFNMLNETQRYDLSKEMLKDTCHIYKAKE